jgi:hypothetical protein
MSIEDRQHARQELIEFPLEVNISIGKAKALPKIFLLAVVKVPVHCGAAARSPFVGYRINGS